VKKILIAVVAVFVLSSFAVTQTQRMAFVDSETILGQLQEAQDAKAAVDEAVKQWQDELDKMGRDLDSSLQDYQNKATLYSQQKKEEEQKKLSDMQQKIRDLQLKRQQDAAQLRDAKFQPIRNKVLKAIEGVAKEEGFTFVFDKLNQTVLLYADVKYDLTWKVIDRLKRGPSPKTK
jgi:outer membrane protein